MNCTARKGQWKNRFECKFCQNIPDHKKPIQKQKGKSSIRVISVLDLDSASFLFLGKD
jgi:hypothetical protein